MIIVIYQVVIQMMGHITCLKRYQTLHSHALICACAFGPFCSMHGSVPCTRERHFSATQLFFFTPLQGVNQMNVISIPQSS